ncbi:MAG: helix-turn-helix domain-containing protein, partial [Pseudonocardia sp.]
ADRVEAFHHLISATHLPWDLDVDARAFTPGVELVAQPVGPLSVVECACGAVSGRRGRRQIAASPQEYVGALFVHDGWEIVAQGETEIRLEPGMALLWDSTRPARFAVPSRIRKRTLFVPRARLGDLGAERLAGAVLPDGPATRLLEGFLTAVVATLRDSPGPEAERNAGAVVTATVELLTNAVEQRERPAGSGSQRRWTTVRDYVEEHLADPGLDPAAIARGAAVSVRTLYDLFAARGETVARYVMRRRLERARCELERSSATVASVATRWGFADQGTFTRAFRRHYGVTPGSVRS